MIKLSYRESQVLKDISLGKTTKEIAEGLYLSNHTVVSYRKALFQKLDAQNAPSLVRRGFELGYLQLGEFIAA